MTKPAPLSGVRIIDLTRVLAGPYCTYLLALLGAEVIKVEQPEYGDTMRSAGPISELNEQLLGISFCTQNAEKSSITVDLKDPEGVEIVLGLAEKADVFVENYRPGVAEWLGVGEAAVRERRPDIVYASISAYGQDGPLGHRGAYDHVVQAMSGIMQTTGAADSGPTKVGAPYVDYATGLNAAFAVLAGLTERARVGAGQTLDIAMLDTTLLLMANTLTAASNTGVEPEKLGNDAASGSPSSGCFTTSDGTLLAVAANNDHQFESLFRALGRIDVLTDARWESPKARVVNRDSLRQVMIAEFAASPAARWEALLDDAGVPAAAVRTVGQVLSEGQPEARQLLVELVVGDKATPVRVPTIGFKINGCAPAPSMPPPELGTDTDRLLRDLGYDEDEIDDLRAAGII